MPTPLLPEGVDKYTCDLTYVGQLGRFGIRVWCDPAWGQLAEHGVYYQGAAGHTYELNEIYRNSLITVGISRIYQMDMVTEGVRRFGLRRVRSGGLPSYGLPIFTTGNNVTITTRSSFR